MFITNNDIETPYLKKKNQTDYGSDTLMLKIKRDKFIKMAI